VAVAVAVFSSAVTRAVVVGVLAVGLIGFGLYLLLRTRHFTWVGMRLSRWELAWWSFLMSTVTGAGLMLTPVLLSAPSSDTLEQALAAALVHGLAMLVTSTVVAVVVYEVVGLRVLRSAWVNLDRVWAGAFLVAGAFVWLA
jgi:hypothetical protein